VLALKPDQWVRARGRFVRKAAYVEFAQGDLVLVGPSPGKEPGDKGDKPDSGNPDKGKPWKLSPDPGPTYEMAVNAKGAIALARDPLVVYPSTQSPFVLVIQPPPPTAPQSHWPRVYDLRTMRTIGPPVQIPKLAPPYALSPDGTLFAAAEPDTKTIQVWSMTSGKQVAEKLREKQVEISSNGFLDFLADGQLLLTYYRREGCLFQVLDPNTGAVQTHTHDVMGFQGSTSLSPGRRYVAAWRGGIRKGIAFIDAVRGVELQLVDYPEAPADHWSVEGIAFSNDGKLLAAVQDNGATKKRVVTWNMATGALQSNQVLPARIRSRLGTRSANETLQWLPDNSGWLVLEALLMGAADGKQIGALLPVRDDIGNQFPVRRRLLGDMYQAIDKPTGVNTSSLVVEPLPAK
jgi:hypothetical protein